MIVILVHSLLYSRKPGITIKTHSFLNNSEGILALRRPVPFRRQNGIRTHISFFAVRTGLEPVISAVTVRRPLQLDRQTNNLEDRTRIVYKAFSNFLFLLVGNMWSSTTPCICSVLTQQSTILSS